MGTNLRNGMYVYEHDYLEHAPKEVQSLVLASLQKSDENALKEAKALLKKAIKLSTENYGELSQENAMCLYYYGNVLDQQSQHVKANAVKLKLQRAEAKIYGEDHPETISSITSLSSAESSVGNKKKAVS